MISLPDIKILAQIYESANSIVYIYQEIEPVPDSAEVPAEFLNFASLMAAMPKE